MEIDWTEARRVRPYWGEWWPSSRSDRDTESPLHEAAHKGRSEVVTWLLRKRWQSERARQRNCRAALFAACEGGRAGVIDLLLAGAGRLHTGHRDVMWELACKSGNTELIMQAYTDALLLFWVCGKRGLVWMLQSFEFELRAGDLWGVVAAACNHQNLKAIEWLWQKSRTYWTGADIDGVLDHAAMYDDLGMAVWWHQAAREDLAALAGAVAAARKTANAHESICVLEWLDSKFPAM